MVERFGYSLDIGKSLESEESKESKESSASEDSKEEVVVDQGEASVSDNEPSENSSEKDSSEDSESKVDSEDFGEPIVDDSDEEVTGEMLSAKKLKKDILDEIKEDVEGVSEASGTVRADNDIEDLEDDKAVFNPTSEEAYAEESPAEAVEAEHVDDKESVQEEGVVGGEGVSAESDGYVDESSYVSEEKPLSPEEEDVKDMVDESFKENTEADAIIEEDKMQTSNLWKWGVGILILIVLTFVVVKFGFIGPVDNSPSAAVPVDEIPVDSDSTDSLVTDVLPVVQEPVKEVVPVVDDSKEVIKKGAVTIIAEPREKDPEQLLSILKDGLE